jgi:hypothetical protein
MEPEIYKNKPSTNRYSVRVVATVKETGASKKFLDNLVELYGFEFHTEQRFLEIKHAGKLTNVIPIGQVTIDDNIVLAVEQAWESGWADGVGSALSKPPVGVTAEEKEFFENIDSPIFGNLEKRRVGGWLCEICNELVYETSSGRVCENGHGGIEGRMASTEEWEEKISTSKRKKDKSKLAKSILVDDEPEEKPVERIRVRI